MTKDPFREACDRARERTAQLPPHARPVVTRPVEAQRAEQAARPAGDEPTTAAEWGQHDGLIAYLRRASWTVDGPDDAIPPHDVTDVVAAWFHRKLHAIAHTMIRDGVTPSAAHVGQRDGGAAGDDTGRHITQEMVAELDRAAGKTHSADGGVMSTLRRLIDLYETSGAATAPRAGADTPAASNKPGEPVHESVFPGNVLPNSVPRAPVEALLAALNDKPLPNLGAYAAAAEVRRHLDGAEQ